jgi:hypothetical protein
MDGGSGGRGGRAHRDDAASRGAPLERTVLRFDKAGRGRGTRFVFKNPHAFLYFEAVDPKGEKVEWQLELGAAAPLTRVGWTPATLKPGTVIKVVGQPSRAEGTHGMCCAKITRPDGSPIVPGGRVEEEAAPK